VDELERRIGDAAFARATGGRAAGPGTTVILAGHFAVFTAGARANDLLDEPRTVAAHTDMVDFSRESWIAACNVLARGDALDGRGPRADGGRDPANLLLLVDDIQFVQPALPDRGARERLAAALASDYLRRTDPMPAFHQRELRARGLDLHRVVRRDDTGWLFSERALRAAAVERIRAEARRPQRRPDGPALLSSADGSRIIVRDPSLGEHTLVHSGHTSCAGGYLELVTQLFERGVHRLVAVVPMRCLGPVTVGAELARLLFGATIEVVNIPFGADGAGRTPGRMVSSATG